MLESTTRCHVFFVAQRRADLFHGLQHVLHREAPVGAGGGGDDDEGEVRGVDGLFVIQGGGESLAVGGDDFGKLRFNNRRAAFLNRLDVSGVDIHPDNRVPFVRHNGRHGRAELSQTDDR